MSIVVNKDSKEINEYIANIQCEPIYYPGYNLDEKSEKSGTVDSTADYTVTTKEVITIEGNYDPSIDASYNSLIYPGSLIVANENLVVGHPQKISLTHGPVNVTVDLPGMTSMENSKFVSEATYASVNGSIQEIVLAWLEKYMATNPITGNCTYKSEIVKDEVDVQIKFGCSASFVKNSLNLNGEFSYSKKKSVYLLKYKQVYFTASVPGYEEPSDAFGEAVTLNQVMSNIDETTPPAYVQSVVFGRELYLKFESEASEADLKAAIDAIFTVKKVNVDANIDGAYKDIYNKTSCTFVLRGGSAPVVSSFNFSKEDLTYIDSLLPNNEFTTVSQAAPLSYLVAAIYRNTPIGIFSKTNYINTTTQTFKSGILKLHHKGGYVARFTISWRKITGYDTDNNPIYSTVNWKNNGDGQTAPYHEEIALSGDCDNISINAEAFTFLAWDPWRTIFERVNLQLLPERSITTGGTSLITKYDINPDY